MSGWRRSSSLAPDGATVSADGSELANGVAVWRFSEGGGGVATSVPAGIGTPPTLRARLPYRIDGYHLAFHLTAPAEVTITATVDGQSLEPLELGLVEAGFFDYRLEEAFGEVPPGLLRVDLVGASPYGDAQAGVTRVPERR